jgi:tRNA(Arg) A34 adenosine deaminase TadA
MKVLVLLFCLSAALTARAQSPDSAWFASPTDRPALMQKLAMLPCGVTPTDSKSAVLQKLDTYLTRYQPDPAQAEDRFSLEAVRWALRGVQSGGYGIGAVLVDEKGNILHGAHNQQKQTGRSDLHGEMALLTEFESLPQFDRYRTKAGFTGGRNTIYTEQLRLYTSAEPCPMCFIRVAIAGVDTRYVSVGPDDGMNPRAACLPPFWYQLSQKHKVMPAQNAPVLRRIAHVLFFSYLL